jgi:hypothetical protein
MTKPLHTLLTLSLVIMFFSCRKEDDSLNITTVKPNNLTNASTATTVSSNQAVTKEDGYISGVVNSSICRYTQHTLDCKGKPTDFDNSLTVFADGSKQIELIRNASTFVGSDRWEIVSGDDIDKMSLPVTLKAGSLAWTHAVSGSKEVVYRGIFGAGANVTITSKVGNRLQGTFTGSLTAENSASDAIQVKNGVFDINIITKAE